MKIREKDIYVILVRNPYKLFLATYEGSVFYGDGQGMPEELSKIENIPDPWW